jgi:ketosteroid isomerase-like protein
MSQENVDAFKAAIEAINHRDWDKLLEGLDLNVEWHPASSTPWAGAGVVYRGHADVREWFESVEEAFSGVRTEFPEIRDLGDRIVAIGKILTRGGASGAKTESPLAYIVEYENEKATRVWSYLDPGQALDAAGLSE